MAKRSGATFAKRQKELARKEKAQKKFDARMERKRLSAEGVTFGGEIGDPQVVDLEGFEPLALPDEVESEEPITVDR